MGSNWPEEVGRRRNLRKMLVAVAGERGPWRRLAAPALDSLQEVVEEIEAHLVVCSDGGGGGRSSGAKAERWLPWGVVLPFPCRGRREGEERKTWGRSKVRCGGPGRDKERGGSR
jgi:hypothetical protein